MPDSHTSVAIAQTVFYVPMVPVSIYLLIRNWHNGRLASWPLVPFSIVRLAGGIIVIVLEKTQPDNLGLIIAALVLLGVGLVPLIISTKGLLDIVWSNTNKNNRIVKLILGSFRPMFLVPVGLLIASGSLADNSSTAAANKALSRAAYIIFMVLWVLLAIVQAHLTREKSQFPARAITILNGTILAMPFLLIRTIYSLLDVFAADYLSSMWSPLFGNAVAFALMGLLLEYIILCIYVYLGFQRIGEVYVVPVVDEEVSLQRARKDISSSEMA